MISQTGWIEGLRKYRTLADLKRSAFYAEFREQTELFLETPQLHFSPDATPRLDSFLRIAQWNIEKGKRFDTILDRLRTDDVLKWADILILNEADQGMCRSQNRHVALDLANELGMNMAFGPAHFELTKGTDDELTTEGENRKSIQGNAILSRYPILEARIVRLPQSFEPYEFHEKRFGGRMCLWARLQPRRCAIWVGSVHLELRNTPGCRAAQMAHVMKNLPGKTGEVHVLGGDLNTNGFARGTAWRTVKSVLRLMLKSPSSTKVELIHPECGREPLFDVLRHCGFAWQDFNSNEETARAEIDTLEELGYLPVFLARLIKQRLEPYQGYLCFKLDWILGRDLQALRSGQRRDSRTGVTSLNPASLEGINAGTNRISDHLPIYADLDLA